MAAFVRADTTKNLFIFKILNVFFHSLYTDSHLF